MPSSDATKAMMSQLDEAFAKDDKADFIIECKSRQFLVRQYMLKIPPDHMSNASYPWSTFSDTPRIGRLTLDHEDPAVVRAMLQYFYRSDYTDDEWGSCGSVLVFHVVVHDMARRYRCGELQDLAKKRFEAEAWACGKNRFQDLEKAIAIIHTEPDECNKDIREAVLRVIYMRRREIFFHNPDKPTWSLIPIVGPPTFVVEFCNFQLLANRIDETRPKWHCSRCRRRRLMDLGDNGMAICSECDAEYNLTSMIKSE